MATNSKSLNPAEMLSCDLKPPAWLNSNKRDQNIPQRLRSRYHQHSPAGVAAEGPRVDRVVGPRFHKGP